MPLMQPANMLLDDKGKLRMNDFGCAWVGPLSQLPDLRLKPSGTAFYVAPEMHQLAHQVRAVLDAPKGSDLAAAASAAAASVAAAMAEQPAALGSPQGWAQRAAVQLKAVLRVLAGAPAAHTPAATTTPTVAAASSAQPPAAPTAGATAPEATSAASKAGLGHLRGYNSKADVYSAVMSSLAMLAGGSQKVMDGVPDMGIGDMNDHSVLRRIFRGQVRHFADHGPGGLLGVWEHPVLQQEVAADFFRRGLCQDPDARPSAQELLSHPWLTGVGV